VLNASQITVSLNGVATSAFSYNIATKQLSFNASLISGANVISVSATTTYGSDSKSQTIIYSQQVVTPAPLVTITSPSVNPFNISTNISVVNAIVTNVLNASQITVSLNGAATTGFSYNVMTKQLSFNANLISGANIITIVANNSSGSDSKSTTIIYTAPVVVPAPVVTITSPSVNPFNTSTSTISVNASVLNVLAASQIAATLNGATIPFTFNAATKQLSLSAGLISGANVVTVSAINTSGSDSKSTTITYTAPVALPAPVITFTTPTALGTESTTAVYNVEATVLNVLSSSGITVKVNGVSLTGFTYSASTKQVKFNANLNIGSNTVAISATNASGSDSKSVIIKYKLSINPLNSDSLNSPVNPGNPNVHHPGGVTIVTGGSTGTTGALPTIVFGLNNPYVATTPEVTVTAVIGGVASQSDIVAKVNGVVVPFTYTLKTKSISFSASVNVGGNTITVVATNSSGAKTENLTITRP
jgi:hypothetical protein